MAEQVPSIGDGVHFVNANDTHVPAIICSITDAGTLNLFVMDDQMGAGFQYNVSEGSQRYSWHWPESVSAKED